MHFSNVLTTKVLKPSDCILEIKAEKKEPLRFLPYYFRCQHKAFKMLADALFGLK